MRRFFKFFLLFSMLFSISYGKNLKLSGSVAQDGNALVFSVDGLDIKKSQIGQITHKKLLQCDNDFNGFIEYVELKKLKYYSTKPLKAGVKYSCKINEPYSSELSEVSFKTDDFELKRLNFTRPNILSVEFNDDVKSEEVLKHLSLKKVTKLNESKLSYKIERDDKKHFLLRVNEPITNEDKILFFLSGELKSAYGAKIFDSYKITLSDEPESKVYKYTKSFVFLNEPIVTIGEEGKISIRVFSPSSFYGNNELKNFIKIDGISQFSVGKSRWLSYEEQEKYKLEEDNEYYFDISGDFKPNTTYKIRFLKGFGDRYKQLFKEQNFTVATKDYGSFVGFSDVTKPYISSVGDIGIKSLNVQKIQVVIDKMTEQNLRYYLNFNSSISLDDVSEEVVNETFDVGGEKNKYQEHKIPLSKALKGLKKGVYQISLHYNGGERVVKKVFLSDIGISAKVFKDGIFIYANSLKDVSAISNAKVEVFSTKNSLIASGVTNDKGVFEYEKQDFYSLNPKSILITKDDEQNFLILDNAWNANSVDMYPEHKQKAFIYFQSKLIRPDANLKGIVVLKDKDFKSLKNAPIGVWIVNLQNHKRVYEKAYKSDEVGSFDFDISTLGFSTGQYRFMVRYKNEVISSKKFLIKAFLPQKIKNELKTSKKIYGFNEPIEINASSKYLFGSPVANLSAEVRLKVVPRVYENEKFKGFSFNDELKEEKSKIFYADMFKRFYLNENGQAKVSLEPNIKKFPPSILQAQIELGVYDDGRKVSNYEDVFIYPYKNMVGLKIENSVLDNDTPVDIKSVLIDPFTNKQVNAKLDVFVYSEDWHYSYDSNGYYKWSKEVKEVEHFTINSDEGIKKKFERSGDYVIVVKDSLSGHSSSVRFSVRGWNYSFISPNSNTSENEVKFEDKLYKKGDVVKLDVKSPIKKGKLLVTLESDKVHWYGVVDFQNHRAKVDVPLNVPLNDGLFISTTAIKSSEVSNIVAFRAGGTSFIKPNRLKHKLNPQIISLDKIKSNSDLNISIKAKPNSKVLVSLVDDGILQILDQTPPMPYKFFTIKPKPKILNFDMYDMLLAFNAKGKALDFGSGALAKAMMKKARKHLAPKTGAKRVKPFMYFSKLVSVDENGEAKVSVKVPVGFNGSVTVAAIEISENAIGSSSKKVTIKDDVIIKPIFPRYGNVGDKWQIKTRVFNTTDKELNIALNAKTNELLKLSGFDKNIVIKPKSSQLLDFSLEVLGFGKGEVKLIASTPNDTFSSEVELPLIYPYPLSTYAVLGQSRKEVHLKAPEEYMKAHAKFSLSVSGDVLASLKGASDDLVDYPYGCAEQTSSKMLALLNIVPFLDDKNRAYLKAKLHDRDRFINEGIAKLASMQKGTGDFGYWDANSYTNVYASVYASDVLIDLKNSGYEVPNGVIEGIKKSLNYDFKYSNDEYIKVYTLYLLAVLGDVDVAKVNYIYDKKLYENSLPSFYMLAYVLKKAKMDSEAGYVLKQAYEYKFKDKKRDHWSFYSRIKDEAFALYLHVKHFSKNDASSKLFSNVSSSFKELYSTQDKAFVLRAINEYYKNYKADKHRFVITTQNIDEIYDYKANIDGELKKNSVKIVPKDDWISYSFSAYAYIPKPILHSKEYKDLDIYREFVDEDGKEVHLNELKLGQQIYSKITIKSLDDLQNIAVVEQIPSCFEFSDEKISRFKSNKLDFTDIRDDRKLIFLSPKSDKPKVFYTPLTVSIKGECLLPPILSEAMYDERISDYDLQTKSVIVR